MRLASLMLVPLLLAACAPSATTPSTSSGGRTGLKGPLPTGETWTISGFDQNNNKISGKVKLSGGPTYRDGDRRWDYDGDSGYILYYEKDGGSSTFRVWDVSDPKRLVACYIFRPFDAAQKTYTGAGLAGTQEEISAVFAKLSGTGTVLTGGNCTVTRE